MRCLTSWFAATALILGSPTAALAFGGLFALDGGPTHEPVELEQAHVVFEMNSDSVTAHVMLSFDGRPEAIAWVLPVTDVPVVTDSSLALFEAVEEATALSVRMPASEPCLAAGGAPSEAGDIKDGCGCGGATDLPEDPNRLAGPDSEHPPSIARGTSFTTGYEVETIGAATSDRMIRWLRDEGFAVSDNMAPAMDAYDRFGQQFVVIRFSNDGAAGNTAPIALTFPGARPTIPLALTSVAAQPHFSLLVTVLADEIYTAENYVAIAPVASEILFDEQHEVSYFEWTARAASKSAGHLFVSEFIGLNPLPPGTMVGDHELKHLYVSRFFTRISPQHMDADPTFRPHPNQTYRMDGRIDLVTEPSLYTCNALVEERLPSPCAFNFCGATGTCTVVDDRAACICAPGDVAERVTAPDGDEHVVCAPRQDAYGFVPDPVDAADPCASVTCGEGSCVAKHGRATCDCLPEMAARLDGEGIACVITPDDAPTFGPGAGVESRPMTMAAAQRDHEAVPVYAGALGVVALLLLRRRRRP